MSEINRIFSFSVSKGSASVEQATCKKWAPHSSCLQLSRHCSKQLCSEQMNSHTAQMGTHTALSNYEKPSLLLLEGFVLFCFGAFFKKTIFPFLLAWPPCSWDLSMLSAEAGEWYLWVLHRGITTKVFLQKWGVTTVFCSYFQRVLVQVTGSSKGARSQQLSSGSHSR